MIPLSNNRSLILSDFAKSFASRAVCRSWINERVSSSMSGESAINRNPNNSSTFSQSSNVSSALSITAKASAEFRLLSTELRMVAKLSSTGDAAGGTPAARRREPSTVGETVVAGPVQRLYPLEIYVDGKFFRYATCYVTIGMMAEAVGLYNEPKMRKILKTKCGRDIGSYTNLAGWYFKNRRKKVFLPDFKLNGNLQPKKTSDYAAINGKYVARVMRGREDYKSPTIFHSKTDRLTSFWRLFNLMAKSILFHVPSSETKGDILEFIEPATIELQAEGESKTFRNVKTIEIRKSKKYLKVFSQKARILR